MNVNDFMQFDLFEIRNDLEIVIDDTKIAFKNKLEMELEYSKLVDNAFKKGYKVHYAPREVIKVFEQKSTNA